MGGSYRNSYDCLLMLEMVPFRNGVGNTRAFDDFHGRCVIICISVMREMVLLSCY